MRALLREIAHRAPDENPYTGSHRARELRARLDAPAPQSPQALYDLLLSTGQAELRLGNVQRAIDAYRAAERVQASLKPSIQDRARLQHTLGVAWLQLGERQNCCQDHNAESCIFPIQGAGIHIHRRGSREAAACFERVVGLLGTDDPGGLAALWLLNVAHMTLGTWPRGVPKAMRLEAEALTSSIDFPRLLNIAPDLGLHTADLAGGVVVEDFDGDGLLDILTSSWDPLRPMHYFRNTGTGDFVEQTEAAGLGGLYGGLNLKQADYDNDGDVDVLVLRGAWLMAAGRHPNSLLRNDGKGHFEDVTFKAGLGDVHAPTQVAGWADFDLDGDLDLYIGNESHGSFRAPCQLFRNDGDGTFTDVAAAAGVQNDRFTKGVSWGDYDSDGDPDLYVSNHTGANRLYRNDGDGTFTDVAVALDVQHPHHSFPVWFWDYDNDGALDLYVPSYHAEIADVAAHYLGRPAKYEPSRLYRGDGRGGFTDATKDAGLRYPVRPMGSNFGDLDGDGFLDIYLGTGDPNYESLMPNVLFVNRGGRAFVDATVASGLGHLQKGHGISFADLDNDGDLDVFNQLGGAYPGDSFHNALYENPGFGQRWIALSLEGLRSNRSAIGAHLHLRVQDADGTQRSVHRHVGGSSSFGANPLRQTIGLGEATQILSLDITWPLRGSRQRFTDLPLDAALRIVEGTAQPERLTRTRVALRKRL